MRLGWVIWIDGFGLVLLEMVEKDRQCVHVMKWEHDWAKPL